MDMLQISHISKSFGKNQILKDLSIDVPKHCIFGFIGQNGAGKTTTMKLILGLLKPDKGDIFVNGQKVQFGENSTNQWIGYLPDVPEFYGFMTPSEYLKMCGEITGMKSDLIKKRSDELLELVGLASHKKRIKGFSRGMKQRLGIAQALINNPKLLICDEPTSALDPVGRKEILDILKSVKEHTTVVFSTHILSDVEKICDRAAFLHNGSIVLERDIADIKNVERVSNIEIDFIQHQEALHFIELYGEGELIETNKVILSAKSQSGMLNVLGILSQNQFNVIRVQKQEPSLEDLFLTIINQDKQ
ncbi:MAG: ABC transporter ATP-binding protein [Lachnospira sp.]|jgi:ABC-2 type transport system ATP-binding protein|nr:ABC transporter ATP-binding protein [Lachnospira sp.]